MENFADIALTFIVVLMVFMMGNVYYRIEKLEKSKK